MTEESPSTSTVTSEVSESPTNWKEEALEVAKDIYSCVTLVNISEELTTQNQTTAAYLNIQTLENTAVTVRVNSAGFTVVGNSFDNNILETSNSTAGSFETPYSLLHSISPQYSETFAAQLHHKLSTLVEKEKSKKK